MVENFTAGARDLNQDLSFAPFARQVKAVVFDLDGTLCDSVGQIVQCTRLTFKYLDLPQPEEDAIKAIIGKKLQEGLESLLPAEIKHRSAEVTAVYRDLFAEKPDIRETRLFPWVPELLSFLKSHGYKIGYASGRSRKGIERSLAESILGNFNDGFCAGDEVPSKPNPAMARIAAQRLGAQCHEILGVGDAGMDVQLFQNASCVSCGVQTGVWSGPALLRLKPNLLLPHAGLLPSYLGS